MKFAEIMKKAREKKRISLRELASRLQIAPSAAWAWERAGKMPSGEMFIKVANELDIVEDLFPGYVKEKKEEYDIVSQLCCRIEELERKVGI